MNIEEILKKHVGEDGKLNQEAASKELKEAQGIEFVPKADFNAKNEDLKTANATLTTLQKDNKDVETLQTEIANYKTKVEKLEIERTDERKTYAIKEALTKEGVSDVDYMMYKMGDVEVDKDGNVSDLDSKIKSLKESNPTFFGSQEEPQDKDNKGYEPIDNKLDTGKQTNPEETATADFEAALGIKSE